LGGDFAAAIAPFACPSLLRSIAEEAYRQKELYKTGSLMVEAIALVHQSVMQLLAAVGTEPMMTDSDATVDVASWIATARQHSTLIRQESQ
jgi:hypothetical protein